MKSRKTYNADLENKRGLMLWVGRALALGIILYVIEMRQYEKELMDLGTVDVELEDEIAIATEREVPPPPPPPPAAPPEVIQIVENNLEIEEVDFESSEMEEDEVMEIFEEEEETDEVFNFMVVENKPIFPGCEDEATEDGKFQCFNRNIMLHIKKHFEFPELARQMEIQGKVYVNFVIEKDGSVSSVQIARGVDKLIDDEAIRVIKKLPKFIPAKQRGRPVRMQYTVPINATLSQ